jgi:hypothetical protein
LLRAQSISLGRNADRNEQAILQGYLALIVFTQATAQKTNQASAPDDAATIPVTASNESVTQVRDPDPDIGVKSLDARKKAQMEMVN